MIPQFTCFISRPVLLLVGASLLIASSASMAAAIFNDTRARANYMLHCQGCHQSDGTGLHDRVPDLNGQLGEFLHVPGGREFIAQVPGVVSAPLTNEALAELLNWLLHEFSAAEIPVSFKPYTDAEIARLRQGVKMPVYARRQALRKAISVKLKQSKTSSASY